QFSWFLFLNRDRAYSLKIKSNRNEHIIDYHDLIADYEEQTFPYQKEKKDIFFKTTYIRWKEKIGDDYFYYFLNSEKKEIAKEFTSFNRNGVDFFHSFYVQSDYFDSFVLNKKDSSESLFEKNRHSPIFKQLIKDLNDFITEKHRLFLQQNRVDELINKYEKDGYFPKFGKNKYDKDRKKDLLNVVKEIYILEPRIFEKVKKEQAKTTIGFLNLLLDTDERDNIITIIEQVVELTKEQRSEFANILKKTKLSNVVRTIKLIENRFKAIEILRKLVFDLKKFTNERDHIQKAIENNYWLFGEQFHLVSADKNFEQSLKNYLYIIDEIDKKDKEKIKLYQDDKNRRPDIFMCQKRIIDDPQDYKGELEENIIVELKRPTVTIGKKQFRQVDDYLDFIVNEEGFNSQTRLWKFFVVSNNVDDYIKKQYEAFKDKGKRFLIYQAGNYEIFAMTWDDIFRSFEIKHRFLLDKLDYDKKLLNNELQSKGIDLNKQSSIKLVDKLIKTEMN
ncbi:MAG: ATP-binding protein, partial [Bacteroidota bacterium]|nr:ATP-binding protein [Bacteroidota bacterium]